MGRVFATALFGVAGVFGVASVIAGCSTSHLDCDTPEDAGSSTPLGDAAPGPRPDGASLPPGRDSGAPGPLTDAGRPPTGGRPLAMGDGELVNLFVAESGLLVVLRDSVLLVSREGATTERWVAPREITSASFDGTYLGVADRAALTTLTPALEELRSTFLTEPCESSVIVSGHRFVCGPENDWDRVFYTYDLSTGAELARSEPETYNGIPMRRVPGTDAFVTVTVSSSPSDFHYYAVRPTGRAEYFGESPYHGDFRANDVYAFHGSPATHLITHEGVLLDFEDCMPGGGFAGMGCFLRDGMLGTLRTGEVFGAMDTGVDGYVYALTHTSGGFSSDARCAAGTMCTVQRIDVAARSIVASSPWTQPFEDLVALRHDPMTGGVVIGTHASCDFGRDCTDWSVRSASLD